MKLISQLSHKFSKDSNLSSLNVNFPPQNFVKKDSQPASVCFCCKQSHYIASCSSFKAKSLHERRDFVKQSSLCFNCLGKHHIQGCKSECRCLTCKGKHHILLHVQATDARSSDGPGTYVPASFSSPPSSDPHLAPISTHLAKVHRNFFSKVLLATARVCVEPNGLKVIVRTLIDQCS